MHLDSYCCIMCVSNEEEDTQHLFFNCTFVDACWTYLNIQWDTSLDFQTMLLRARERFGSVIFREVMIHAMWSIWTLRNSIIFYYGSLSFDWWHRSFTDGLKALTLRVKPNVKDAILHYMSSLL
ncbi:hypothetical protein HU200_016952 [Digitaria exilis]|uniref:Reverse transcriptase zinc-binding domain-containing protein n=1 Tax=Digitaria exilis TaxID=1010633 RepID=A0A835F7E5_9POAL|nr:hypothetical protein HU200_016952 [Digitaria exilis]